LVHSYSADVAWLLALHSGYLLSRLPTIPIL
jgi:hypothetical protein